jgi:hypothetical protein
MDTACNRYYAVNKNAQEENDRRNTPVHSEGGDIAIHAVATWRAGTALLTGIGAQCGVVRITARTVRQRRDGNALVHSWRRDGGSHATQPVADEEERQQEGSSHRTGLGIFGSHVLWIFLHAYFHRIVSEESRNRFDRTSLSPFT